MTEAPDRFVNVKEETGGEDIPFPATAAGRVSVTEFERIFKTPVVRRGSSGRLEILRPAEDGYSQQLFGQGEVLILRGVGQSSQGRWFVAPSTTSVIVGAATFVFGVGLGAWWGGRRIACMRDTARTSQVISRELGKDAAKELASCYKDSVANFAKDGARDVSQSILWGLWGFPIAYAAFGPEGLIKLLRRVKP